MGCGVAALVSEHPEHYVSSSTLLYVLENAKNRGDDGTGILLYRPNRMLIKKWLGTAKDMPGEIASELKRSPTANSAMVALGHARYATYSVINLANNHPVLATYGTSHKLALVMNGEISFTERWLSEASKHGIDLHGSDVDTAHCAAKILLEVLRTQSFASALLEFFKQAYPFGGFTILGLYASPKHSFFFYMRDGLRPLYTAKSAATRLFFSETSHVNGLPVTNIKEVKPCEIGLFNLRTMKWRKLNACSKLKACYPKALCPFELAYFQNYNSRIDSVSIDMIRRGFGKALCQEHPPPNKAVISWVPRSGISATQGYFEQALLMGRDVEFKHVVSRRRKSEQRGERSFLGHRSMSLDKKLARKFQINSSEITADTILLIDDSIVRGNVSAWLAHMVEQAGAKRVVFMSAWPPMVGQCRAGVDINEDDLLALGFLPAEHVVKHHELLEQKLSEGYNHKKFGFVKFTEVRYVSPKGVKRVFKKYLKGKLCTGCFERRYAYIHTKNLNNIPYWLKQFIKMNKVDLPQQVQTALAKKHVAEDSG
jgi:amidophosphoribosyltransferase